MLLLELLPVQALLLVFTAAGNSPLGSEPISPLISAMLLVAAWAAGAILRGAPVSSAVAVVAPCCVAACALVLLTSPSAYAGSANPVGDLLGDLGGATPRVFADAGLMAVTLFVGWRGYVAGSEPPSGGSVGRSFKLGLAVVLLAVACAALIHNPQQGPLLGALALMLPVEVYVGLVASALARIHRERLRNDVVVAAGTEGSWLGMALGLSGVLVCATLILSLVINYGSVGALLSYLGPVGGAINAIVSAVTNLIGLLLYLLLNPVVQGLKGKAGQPSATPPQGVPTCPPGTPAAQCIHAHNTVPPEWLHAAVLVAQVLVVLMVIAVALWLLRRLIAGRRLFAPPMGAVEEERESLDASSLLGAQLRALLAGLRRPPSAPDPLTPGTVRYLYRDVLRAAARAGVGRAAAETPDEFAARTAWSAPPANGATPPAEPDITALSEAYDAARYAEREPEQPALGALRATARRITDMLRRRGRE